MKRSTLLALGGIAAGAWFLARGMRSFDFAERVFLISGGSRGLGLVLARQICSEGGCVALLARDEAELHRAQGELTSRGADVLTVMCDVADRGQIERAVAATADHFGRIDALFNVAGIIEVGPLEHMSDQDFERSLAVHFWAAYHLVNAALPHLRRAGEARIVNITSIGGKVAVPHLGAYSVGKFAAVGYSDAIRAELARERIHVTTVVPGMMRTGSHVNARFKGDHGAEFSWFAASAGAPVVSMNAERAAARILDACKRGQPVLEMPLVTRAATIGNALLPNITARLMQFANVLLPRGGNDSGNELFTGRQSRTRAAVPSWITRLADRATLRNNGGPTE